MAAVMKYARIANLEPSHVAIDHAPAPVEHHLSPCQQELNYLEAVVKAPRRPFCAIVGGSKVSSKIDVLHALIASCDTLIIGCEHAFLHHAMQCMVALLPAMHTMVGSIAAASALPLRVLQTIHEAVTDMLGKMNVLEVSA